MWSKATRLVLEDLTLVFTAQALALKVILQVLGTE